MTNVK